MLALRLDFGLHDSVACNYNPIAVCDDASCVYPPFNLANCNEGEVLCGPGTYWVHNRKYASLPTLQTLILMDALG